MRSRHGLKALGLSVLMLSVMALSASAAQAAPKWMLGSENVTALKVVTATVVEEELAAKEGIPAGKWEILLSEANSIEIAIACKKVIVVNAEFLAEGKGSGTVEFGECVTYTREKIGKGQTEYALKTACNPSEQPIKAGGTLQIGVVGGVTEVKAEGTGTGGKFTTIHFPCAALPEEVEVTGTAWFKDCKGDPETLLLEHLLELDNVHSTLKFGTHTKTGDGSMLLEVRVGGVMKEFSMLKE